jgi:hypothetical protein
MLLVSRPTHALLPVEWGGRDRRNSPQGNAARYYRVRAAVPSSVVTDDAVNQADWGHSTTAVSAIAIDAMRLKPRKFPGAVLPSCELLSEVEASLGLQGTVVLIPASMSSE